MATTSIFDQFFYHGSPVSIDKFSYEFTGRGTDELGSGFNFVNRRSAAIPFCDLRESGRRVLTEENNPTIHQVKLNIRNPLGSKTVRALSMHEVEQLLTRAPNYLEHLEDFGDIEREGLGKALERAIAGFSGKDKGPLLQVLNDLSSDFYDDEIEAFNTVAQDVLGYDGVIRKVDSKTVIAVAWFPEQIELVSRTKISSMDNESEGPSR
jgi:hypothetical protein